MMMMMMTVRCFVVVVEGSLISSYAFGDYEKRCVCSDEIEMMYMEI